MRQEIHMDQGDQKVVEVPCELIPGAKLGDHVARVHHAKLWHVTTEEKSDGTIISEVGLHGGTTTTDGVTRKPVPPQHKFHVRVHEHKHASMATAMGPAIS